MPNGILLQHPPIANGPTGENSIEQGLPITGYRTSAERKPLWELCGIRGGSVRLPSGPASPAPHNRRRHREISCGGPHKISQSHSELSGNFDTDKHSVGSTNAASLVGRERNRDASASVRRIVLHDTVGVLSQEEACDEMESQRNRELRFTTLSARYRIDATGLQR